MTGLHWVLSSSLFVATVVFAWSLWYHRSDFTSGLLAGVIYFTYATLAWLALAVIAFRSKGPASTIAQGALYLVFAVISLAIAQVCWDRKAKGP